MFTSLPQDDVAALFQSVGTGAGPLAGALRLHATSKGLNLGETRAHDALRDISNSQAGAGSIISQQPRTLLDPISAAELEDADGMVADIMKEAGILADALPEVRDKAVVGIGAKGGKCYHCVLPWGSRAQHHSCHCACSYTIVARSEVQVRIVQSVLCKVTDVFFLPPTPSGGIPLWRPHIAQDHMQQVLEDLRRSVSPVAELLRDQVRRNFRLHSPHREAGIVL